MPVLSALDFFSCAHQRHARWSLLKFALGPFGQGVAGTTQLFVRLGQVLSLSTYAGMGMSPTELSARYREFATKCIVVARGLQATNEKLALLDMAQAWIDLAAQAEKNERLAVVYETPEPA